MKMADGVAAGLPLVIPFIPNTPVEQIAIHH